LHFDQQKVNMAPMGEATSAAGTTRDRLREEALRLFADRGYWGVSIAQIGTSCGITKQSLLHHFGSKEKLYREVLEAIAAELQELVCLARANHATPAEQMWELLALLGSPEARRESMLRVIMRELLDIGERAETAGTWPLRGFLDSLDQLLAETPAWSTAPREHRLAAAYRMLGALKYKVISTSTLKGMYGQEAYEKFESAYREQLRLSVEATLGEGELIAPDR
jgi:AcrR family transcriptional regulator